MLPSQYFFLPQGEKVVVRAFLNKELEERANEIKRIRNKE